VENSSIVFQVSVNLVENSSIVFNMLMLTPFPQLVSPHFTPSSGFIQFS
jgi:hypothetical protein